MDIISISSQVVYGPVGNSAAVPALEQAGFSVLQIPTTVLSNHPGHCIPAATDISAQTLAETLGILEKQSWTSRCTAVMTGYFRDEHQIEAVASAIIRLKQCNPSLVYLCDPVMGDDHTDLYVPVAVASAIKQKLLPLANAITPNRFELQWITQIEIAGLTDAISAARNLPCPISLVTSLPAASGHLATAVIAKTQIASVTTKHRPHAPHGAGDILSGLFLAKILQGIEPAIALGQVMASLEHILDCSGETGALALPSALDDIDTLTALPVETTHD